MAVSHEENGDGFEPRTGTDTSTDEGIDEGKRFADGTLIGEKRDGVNPQLRIRRKGKIRLTHRKTGLQGSRRALKPNYTRSDEPKSAVAIYFHGVVF